MPSEECKNPIHPNHKNKDHYALVIGIRGYAKLPMLPAAEKDAVDFANWLKSEDGGGLCDRNVQLLVSGEGSVSEVDDATPGVKEIEKALTRLGMILNEPIGSRLYFYFAGHGIGPQFDEVGMLLANAANPHRLGSNLGLGPYRHSFRNSRMFNEVIFILDCCRDPRAGIKLGNPSFQFPGESDANDPRDIPVTDFVALAADHGEKAFTVIDDGTYERRGLLTQAVLKALQVDGAVDGLGRVTVETLKEYVNRLIPVLAEKTVGLKDDPKAGTKQRPKFLGPDPEREIVLAVHPAALVRVQIVARPGVTGRLRLAEFRNGEPVPIEERPAAEVTNGNPPWERRLVRSRYYLVQHLDDHGQERGEWPLKAGSTQQEPEVLTFPP